MSAAAQKCFGLFELLEHTLSFLPPTDLTRVMRVSSAWKQTIERSKSLRESRAVSPLATESPSESRHSDSSGGMPLYARQADIKPNTILQAWSKPDWFSEDVLIEVFEDERHTLWKASSQFATFLPCKVMHLRTMLTEMTCIIYIKGGIRIKDLLEVSASLLEGEGVLVGKTYISKDTLARFSADEDDWETSTLHKFYETFPF